MRPLLWIPMIVLRSVAWLAGLVMVPLMLRTANRPAWLFRPWHDTTGVAAWWPRYVETRGNFISRRFPNFWWLAIRNPSNGLRTYPLITVRRRALLMDWTDNGMPTNPRPLRRAGRRIGWLYIRQGAYSGLWLCVILTKSRHMKIRWGWKLIPDGEQFENEWKPEQAGFAMSTLLWRRG